MDLDQVLQLKLILDLFMMLIYLLFLGVVLLPQVQLNFCNVTVRLIPKGLFGKL